MFLEILQLVVGVGDDGVRPGLPAGRADLAVLISILEGLHQPKGLVHAAPDRQVIHRDLSQHALRVDYEESSQGVTVFLQVHTVVLQIIENIIRKL